MSKFYTMNAHTQVYKDTLGWGFLIWLFGYVLGILLFFAMPKSMIGWVIMPIATVITLWVLIKKIKSTSMLYYSLIASCWILIAIILDYIFIVKVLHPQDGYYKTDVYLYYTLTFILPLLVGFCKSNKST